MCLFDSTRSQLVFQPKITSTERGPGHIATPNLLGNLCDVPQSLEDSTGWSGFLKLLTPQPSHYHPGRATRGQSDRP